MALGTTANTTTGLMKSLALPLQHRISFCQPLLQPCRPRHQHSCSLSHHPRSLHFLSPRWLHPQCICCMCRWHCLNSGGYQAKGHKVATSAMLTSDKGEQHAIFPSSSPSVSPPPELSMSSTSAAVDMFTNCYKWLYCAVTGGVFRVAQSGSAIQK